MTIFSENPSSCAPSSNTLVIISNTSWSLLNYRSGLIEFLRSSGFRVVSVAPEDDFSDGVVSISDHFIRINLSRKGANPWSEAGSLLEIFRVLKSVKPRGVLAFTPKPNIYAGIACGVLGIPCIHNIAGLGSAFGKKSLLQFAAKLGYAMALKRAAWVFFQNRQDRDFFLEENICSQLSSSRIPGSGVDCVKFSYVHPSFERGFTFLMCSRFLREKGVDLFVNAAVLLKKKYPDSRFVLLGAVDHGNPDSLTDQEVASINAAGIIELPGFVRDVRPFIADAHCIVHPSTYMEGLPRILLEGSAVGRPSITTDWPGCRDAIQDRKTGILIKARCLDQLIEAMETFIEMDRSVYLEYARQARLYAENVFDESLIHQSYSAAISRSLDVWRV